MWLPVVAALIWLVLVWAGPRSVDNLLYDVLLRSQPPLPVENMLLVAVDDRSIERLGPWPWSRATHAALLQRLSAGGARVVALDVLFADASADAAADAALADAAAAAGTLVLPMVLDRWQADGQMIEVLPYPALAEAAAAIGHAHVSPDFDGVVRGVWLWQGLGSARWPHFSLAVAGLANDRPPGLRAPAAELTGHARRDAYVRVPFLPPDSLPTVSYVDVLDGRAGADPFAGKVVFVGVLAGGLGDRHATPATREGRTVAGVELNAAVYAALAQQRVIASVDGAALLLTNAVLALLPALWLPLWSVRRGLGAVLLLVATTLAASWVGLRLGWWLDPATGLLAALLLWPLHAAVRLERALRFLVEEERNLVRLIDSTPASGAPADDLDAVLARLASQAALQAHGVRADLPAELDPAGGWQQYDGRHWLPLARGGVLVASPAPAADRAALSEAVMQRLAARYGAPRERLAPLDLLGRRIVATRRAAGAVAGLQRFFSASLAGMSEGVLVVDTLEVIVYANEFARSQVPGLRESQALPELDLDVALVDIVRLVLAAGDPQSCEYTAGERCLLAGATRADLGPPWGLVAIVALTDVSRLKQAERARTESLSFISHDLRSPMVSLLARTQRARREPPADFEQFLQDLERHARANIKLSDEFLQLTRLAESSELDVMDFDPAEVVHNVVDQQYPAMRAAGMQLDVELEDGERWCRGDPEAVERALANLVGNAVKYAASGGRVVIGCRVLDERVVYTVRDAGPGIDADDLPQLFDPWFQAQRGPGSAGGSGLGLRYVKLVADRHGGVVRVESVPGRGTTFTLELPAGDVIGDDESGLD